MKKILSLTLVLVMCFAMAAAVSAESWNTTTTDPEAKPEVTVYKAEKAPTLDGVIGDDEWGTPLYTGTPEAPEKNDMIPEKVEYWMSYDANNVYLAARVATDYYKAGGNKVGSYLIPRFPVVSGSNYRGLLAVDANGNPLIDGQMGSKGTQLKIGYKDGVASFEVAIPVAVVQNGNNGAEGQGAPLKEGETWAFKMEYTDQVVAHNAGSGDANDGKMFTYTELSIKIGGDKPAEPVTPPTPSTPSTPSAPATFDAGVIALVAAAAAGAGVVVSKKRR